MRQFSFQRRRYPFEEGAFLYDQMFGHYQVRILEQRLVVYEFFGRPVQCYFLSLKSSDCTFKPAQLFRSLTEKIGAFNCLIISLIG